MAPTKNAVWTPFAVAVTWSAPELSEDASVTDMSVTKSAVPAAPATC